MLKRRKNYFAVDAAFMSLLILVFATVIFIINAEEKNFHIIALTIVFVLAMIAHFTSVTMGLIINILVIFGYSTFLFYEAFALGKTIGFDRYFWIVLCPLMTLATSIIFRNTKQIEGENQILNDNAEKYTLIEPKSGLRNTTCYNIEMPVYSSISRRYKIRLLMIVWEFRFGDDLKRMLGKDAFEETAIRVSKALKESLRKEDVIYLLSENPYLWGTLLLTREESSDLLINRIRKDVEKVPLEGITASNAPKLEMRIGVCYLDEADGDYDTAETLLQNARVKMQYDV